MAIILNKRAFSPEEYYKLAKAATQGRDDRSELLARELGAITHNGRRQNAYYQGQPYACWSFQQQSSVLKLTAEKVF